MYYSKIFGKTLREVPQTIRTPSHALLQRGGRSSWISELVPFHDRQGRELAKYLSVPKERTAKSLVYATPQGLVMAVVRGDYELGLEKLSGYLKVPAYRPATDEELAEVGLVPGYLSPLHVDQRVKVVVDDAVARSNNLVFGANQVDHHLINGNYGRDFQTPEVMDIAVTRDEKICLQCGGILWPKTLAPFQVYLMSVGKSLSVEKTADQLHQELGDRALYDDCSDSPGVKFNDADLIGIPLRIVVGAKNLGEGKVELKERKTGDIHVVALDQITRAVDDLLLRPAGGSDQNRE